MFEAFVVAELVAHLETAAGETGLFACVIATAERLMSFSKAAAKSSTKMDRSDPNHLTWLRDQLGDKFHRGVVLYSGALPFQLADKIWALPISSLWRTPALAES